MNEALHNIKLEQLAEYDSLLARRDVIERQIKNLEKSSRARARDETTWGIISQANEKMHDTHLKLLSVAESLGMSESDVLVDIFRYRNSLEEYDLPEFSILTPDDIGAEFSGGSSYPIDPETARPGRVLFGKEELHKEHLEYKRYKNEEAGEEELAYEEPYEEPLAQDEVLIIFSVSTKVVIAFDVIATDTPADEELRLKRARALAEQVAGRFFEGSDTIYHTGPAYIAGVVIKKNKLEEVVSMIRDNPKKYRIGEDFFSDEELSFIKEQKADYKKKIQRTSPYILSVLSSEIEDIQTQFSQTSDSRIKRWCTRFTLGVLPELRHVINFLKTNDVDDAQLQSLEHKLRVLEQKVGDKLKA